MSKLIGLVTVLYNSEGYIEGFLKSVLNQKYKNIKIYFIDNSDNFNSQKIINKYINGFRLINYEYIKSNENYGVAKGNNIGISNALIDGCDSIILLNNDIEFYDPEIFEKIVLLSNNHDIIFTKILYFNTNIIWYSGGYISRIFGNGIHKDINKADDNISKNVEYTEYGPTCFVLINAKVFNRIGLMDEKYFVYYDDLDFISRANKAKITSIYDPSLRIYHNVSSSTGGGRSLFSLFYNSRNSIYYIKKNFNGFNKYLILLSYTLARLSQSIFLTAKQRSTIIKGLFDGYKM